MNAPIRIRIAHDRIARAQALQSLEGGRERSACDVATDWNLEGAWEVRTVLEQLVREGLVKHVRRPLDLAYALVGPEVRHGGRHAGSALAAARRGGPVLMATIYLVCGETGLYDERQEWLVIAYRNLADAEVRAKACNDFVENHLAELEDGAELTSPFDPRFKYCGMFGTAGKTVYRVGELELAEGSP